MNVTHTIPSGVKRLGGLAAIILAFAAIPAANASAASKASHVSALADTTHPATFLREVVVTGSRFPRKYYQSPQALSFLTASQIREEAPAVVADLLSKLPGVDMSKDSPWEQRPVLRGVSGQRALVLMDGIPMNSARGNGPHPSLIDPSQIDRVEVVRGPSSVAYGSDALGGAINIITRGPRPYTGVPGMSMTGAVSMSGALGDNQYGGSLELQPHIGRLGMLLSGGARHADDFRSADGKIPNSGFEDWDGTARARYDVSDRMTIEAGWQGYRGNNIGIPGLSSPTYPGWPPGWLDVFQFKNYDRDLAHLKIDHKYENSWIASSSVRVYYQGENRNFFDAQDQVPAYYQFGPPDGSTELHSDNNHYFDLKTWGLQIQATSKQTKQYRFTMGVDAARDVTGGNSVTTSYEVFPSGNGPTATAIAQAVPNGHFDNYGAYFENEWYVAPQWTLNTGVRWTQYAYKTFTGLSIPADYFGPGTPAQEFSPMTVNNGAGSGSIGIVYSPTPQLHWSANVANGYRQPNAQDLFYNGFGSVGLVEGNPDLEPEKSVSYDAGMRYENQVEALSGNVFYSTFTDLIDAANVPNPATDPYFLTYAYENVSKARIYGGEAEGEWVVARHYSLHATCAGAVGDITSRDAIEKLYGQSLDKAPLDGVVPFKGTFGTRWNSDDRRFWVEPSARYSWRTNRLPLQVGNVSQPDTFKKEWFVVDVMAGARFDATHLATIGVRNVGDRHYREALASLPAPGRSLVMSFTASF